MQLPWSDYLYAVASLAMTFIGFCTIVLGLAQIRDKTNSKLKLLRQHARGYIVLGFSAVAAALLAPMLAACGLSASLAWRLSSAIIAIGSAAQIWYTVKRFKVLAAGSGIPKRVWINSIISGFVILALLVNSAGVLFEPNAGPVVVAATWRLTLAVVVFMLTYEHFLEDVTDQ
jgi:hypothetical protein